MEGVPKISEGDFMNILIVYAHHEKGSFNSAMKDQAVSILTSKGHKVKISDLYEMSFDPLAYRSDFSHIINGEHINYIMEQKTASEKNTFVKDIKTEMDKVHWANLIIFQAPVWWFSVPAILKGWFDRIFAAGFAWDFGKTYDNGLLTGKTGMLSLTTGGSATAYEPTGINGDINQTLFAINHGILSFCGMTVLEPFIAFSIFQAGDEGRKLYLEQYKDALLNIEKRKIINYHSLNEYDETLRLKKTENDSFDLGGIL